MLKILLIAGARPNFIKIMPLIKEFRRHSSKIRCKLLHTGQHYDANMSGTFFRDLNIPRPDVYLGIGSAKDGAQTEKIIKRIGKILGKRHFDIVIVVGDVNSTLAGALAASKAGVKVAHVEAGLRSFDLSMPEEINRMLTDQVSDYLFTTEASANKNLIKEGIARKKIFFVGNIMIDSYMMARKKVAKSKIIKRLKLKPRDYCLVTIHRPSNVDKIKDLRRTATILGEVGKRIRVLFPVHPRTKKMFKRHKLALKNIEVIDPLGYVDFQRLLRSAKLTITDSGGIQEEAAVAGIPCLTIRENTERPVTVSKGTNKITGTNKKKILESVGKILDGKWKKGARPPKWDGRTAGRITKILLKEEKKICRKN